jgi:two-component system nitrate/nitrite sensor histidine kinase NarX
MRTLLLELRPASLAETTLGDLLRQLTEAVAGRIGTPVTVELDGQCPLPDDVRIALYRIAQEALNNVVKHAQASQVSVRLSCGPTPAGDAQEQRYRVEMRVEDDGRGFELRDIPPHHLGLAIIRERAQAIGATLHIDSKPGQGTKVTVMWKG